MYVLAQRLDATLQYLSRLAQTLLLFVLAQTVDVTLQDLVFYTRRQLMQR